MANDELYTHQVEVWDAKKCAQFSKRRSADAYGTKDPFPGWTNLYNGGCVREEKWYKGEVIPLPEVAEGYEFIQELSWCWRLVHTETHNKEKA